MKSKIVFCIIILLSFFSIVYAKGTIIAGGVGYFNLGMEMPSMSELRDYFNSNGFGEINGKHFSIGGGGNAIIAGLVIGGEGYAFSQELENDSLIADFDINYFFINLGYIVYATRGFYLSPKIAIGGGYINIIIYDKYKELNFNEVINNPKRMSLLSSGGLMLKAEVEANYLLSFTKSKFGGIGLIFGVNVGYKFATFKNGWEIGSIEVVDGPNPGLSGPYVHFKVGFGGAAFGD